MCGTEELNSAFYRATSDGDTAIKSRARGLPAVTKFCKLGTSAFLVQLVTMEQESWTNTKVYVSIF